MRTRLQQPPKDMCFLRCLTCLLLAIQFVLLNDKAYAGTRGDAECAAAHLTTGSALPRQSANQPDEANRVVLGPATSADSNVEEALGTTGPCQESAPRGIGNPACPVADATVASADASPAALALSGNAADRRHIDSLTQRIAQKELELLRLNTYFRLETTDQSRIKPWRVFLYNLTGSGVSNAGITLVAAERWRTWQRPATANRTTLKAGPLCLLIGHSIIAGGVLVESALDLWKDRQAKKRGHDPKSTMKRVQALSSDIDRMLMEREKIVASTFASPEEAAVARAEGRVLKDLRHSSLMQYLQFYARANKRRWARDAGYLNQLAAASTGGFLGSLMGLLAVADRRPTLAGPAGLGFTLSGAHIVIGPLLGRVVGNVAFKQASRKAARELGAISTRSGQVLEADLEELKQAARSAPPDESSLLLANRLKVYDAAKEIFQTQAKMNAAEKKKADREFIERFIFNAGVGGTKMGWGIQLANAGFGFELRPPVPTVRVPVRIGGAVFRAPLPAPKGAANIFAKRVAQGATCYIPGTSLWIFDTLQSRSRGELEIFTLGAQMALPHQKLKNRIAQLENLESLLKGSGLGHETPL